MSDLFESTNWAVSNSTVPAPNELLHYGHDENSSASSG